MVVARLAVPIAVPLSPPHSPPMSGAGSTGERQQYGSEPINFAPINPQTAPEAAFVGQALAATGSSAAELSQHQRPHLRSYKSFPYSLGSSSRTEDEARPDALKPNALADFTERVLSSVPQPTSSANLQQAVFGGSAPVSPIEKLSPASPKVEEDDVLMDDEDLDFGDAVEEEAGKAKRPMTAAELRALKRKMKRFRLTHNQTRFLMSEFARQAHPDAAHRERMSREIPGLSPRQVQVWFQNRRAKLKRLTTDDRERMMRSRALPADFDTTQTLHSPFVTPHANMTAPAASTATFPPFGNGAGSRPLSLDTMQRVSTYESYYPKYSSASAATPALGGAFTFTPPQSATDTMSPGSNVNFNFQTQESSRRPSLSMPYSSQSTFMNHTPPMPPRLQIHDRMVRTGPDVAASPLRSSMSYGVGASIVSENRPERSSSLSDHTSYTYERPRQSRSVTNPGVNGVGPYGLGFSYSNASAYTPDQTRTSQITQPSADYQSPRRSNSELVGPPMTYSPYPSANLPTAQVSQYSNFSAGFIASSFQNPYSYQQAGMQPQQSASHGQVPQQAQRSYTPSQAQSQHFVPYSSATSQQDDQGDNDDGGVPVHLPY